MIDLSLAGLLGAIVGTAMAALVYGKVVEFVEKAVRTRDRAPTVDERVRSEENAALVRRIVLALDIFVCSGIGYWLGSLIGA